MGVSILSLGKVPWACWRPGLCHWLALVPHDLCLLVIFFILPHFWIFPCSQLIWSRFPDLSLSSFSLISSRSFCVSSFNSLNSLRRFIIFLLTSVPWSCVYKSHWWAFLWLLGSGEKILSCSLILFTYLTCDLGMCTSFFSSESVMDGAGLG